MARGHSTGRPRSTSTSRRRRTRRRPPSTGGGANNTQQWLLHNVNMMAWHTWGVIWAPHEISYVVDGRVWGIVTNPAAIPRVPLVLDLEQRTSCSIHAQCPPRPVQMQVDWIAEYRAT